MISRPTALASLLLILGCASGSPQFHGHTAVSYRRAASGPASYASSAEQRVAPASVRVTSSAVEGRVAAAEPEASAPSGGVNLDPAARPGLATSWGEDLRSRVRYSQFERASETPFDTATLWYNDARMLGMQLERAAAESPWITLGPRHDGVRLSLRDEGGVPLRGVSMHGRTFVLGTSGQRYSIVLENRTGASFEALVTVDGLDVLNGQPGSFASRGYVLRPYGTVEVRGFRQSLNHVAAFRFGSVGDSYAADRGDARNVGVIGVALFAERGATFDVDRNEVELREGASPFPSGFAPPPSSRRW
ncbi:MAG: hypothetical protein R3A48_12270 [Polyangiales bacterium]